MSKIDDYEKEVEHFFSMLHYTLFENMSCLFCNGKKKILFHKGTMEVVRCECGFVFNARQPNQDSLNLFYKSQALKTWNSFKTNDDIERQNSKFSHCVNYILEKKYKSVLDIGCGAGYFLNLIRQMSPNIRLVGVDLGIETTYKNNITFIENDYINFFYETKDKYDVISLWGVLEHVKDPGLLLSKAREALNPNGVLMVCVPNCESEIVETLWSKCFTFCPQHLWYFSDNTLDRLLLKEGFDCDETLFLESEANPLAKHSLGFLPYENVEVEWRDMYSKRLEVIEGMILENKKYKMVKICNLM